MPWPTTSGLRNLDGDEAHLVRGAIGMMVDTHVAEIREESERWCYGIDWFDKWEGGQRLRLLEKITSAFFGPLMIEPAAITDAAADAVFYEISDLIESEIEQGSASQSPRSWRHSVVKAFHSQTGRLNELDAESTAVDPWRRVVTQVADAILGVRLYQRAEVFRDLDYSKTEGFLRDRGLPSDYLSKIPPLPSTREVQESIDRIQRYVFV